MTKTVRRQFGDWGESQACSFLIRQGYEIIERNFYAVGGEIDIVARQGEAVCFVEVKTRSYWEEFANAEQATNYLKLKKMVFAAKQYCQQQKIDMYDTEFRFEHVSVYADREAKSVKFKKYILELS